MTTGLPRKFQSPTAAMSTNTRRAPICRFCFTPLSEIRLEMQPDFYNLTRHFVRIFRSQSQRLYFINVGGTLQPV